MRMRDERVKPHETQFTSQNPHSMHLLARRTPSTISFVDERVPSAKVKEGDWVSVYFFPPASTQGWVQVDADHSVTIDISGLDAGTYQVAVAGRDNELLGWAQLDLPESLAAAKGGVLVDTKTSTPSNLGSADWMLVAAGGLLMLGAASFVVLMRPGPAQRR